ACSTRIPRVFRTFGGNGTCMSLWKSKPAPGSRRKSPKANNCLLSFDITGLKNCPITELIFPKGLRCCHHGKLIAEKQARPPKKATDANDKEQRLCSGFL